ncbi:hypothetical protein D3C85_1588130 [compost metagenome]
MAPISTHDLFPGDYLVLLFVEFTEEFTFTKRQLEHFILINQLVLQTVQCIITDHQFLPKQHLGAIL